MNSRFPTIAAYKRWLRLSNLLDERWLDWRNRKPTAAKRREIIALSHWQGRLDPRGYRQWQDLAAVDAKGRGYPPGW